MKEHKLEFLKIATLLAFTGLLLMTSIYLSLGEVGFQILGIQPIGCLLYTSPSPRDQRGSRMPSSA